jgi:hypothetical protein
MSYWVWIGVALSLLALSVIGMFAYSYISSILDDRRSKRLKTRADLEYQQWRASATPEELSKHDEEARKNRKMSLLKETNPREWERKVQIQAAIQKAEDRRRDVSERAKWRGALLGLPITSAVADCSHRSWPRVHEVTTRNDLESLIDFLIDDSGRCPGSPFLFDKDCLASNRDTAISTDRQKFYRVGENVWQYHVESESHD